MEKRKILVAFGQSYAKATEDIGFKITSNVEDFFKNTETYRMVLFTGGSDVDPSIYGDTSPFNICQSYIERDRIEMSIFKRALKFNIVMTGICRGLQFLNVMDGGKMMHHLNNHAGGIHTIKTSSIYEQDTLAVNSFHHQMVIPSQDAKIVGWCSHNLSDVYIGDKDLPVDFKNKEIESVIFPKIRSFGVQYHPEMMSCKSEGHRFYRKMVKDSLQYTWEKFIQLYTEGSNKYDADDTDEVCKYNSTITE